MFLLSGLGVLVNVFVDGNNFQMAGEGGNRTHRAGY